MGHVQHPAPAATALRRAGAVALVFVTSLAHADGTDVATAQVLFDDARVLMKSGDYAAACPKLEESERLANAVGTEFNLADCYEHAGRLASAWARFLQVASTTKALGQTEREQVARDRARLLEPKLGRLAIFVGDGAKVDAMVVTRDGAVVDAPLWGVAVPVDAGDHVIRATAPGHADWTTHLRSADGETSRVNVERLTVAAPPPPLASTSPSSAPPPASATPSSTASVPSPPPPPSPSSAQRTAGWVTLGGGGLLGVLGLVGLLEHNSAVSGYNNDASCLGIDSANPSSECADRVSTAHTWNAVAFIGFLGGGAAVTTGIVLLATSPHATSSAVTVGCAPGLGAVSCFGTF